MTLNSIRDYMVHVFFAIVLHMIVQFTTPLGRSLSVAASDLFALRSHNPSVALFKISLVAKKYRQQKCCLYFLVYTTQFDTMQR